MTKRKFTEEQISNILRQVEGGVPVAEMCEKLGITEKTFSGWKSKYSGAETGEHDRLKKLEEENRKLKLLVVDLSLDKQMLQDVLKKTLESVPKKE